jgi:hypothetical protein
LLRSQGVFLQQALANFRIFFGGTEVPVSLSVRLGFELRALFLQSRCCTT